MAPLPPLPCRLLVGEGGVPPLGFACNRATLEFLPAGEHLRSAIWAIGAGEQRSLSSLNAPTLLLEGMRQWRLNSR